MRPGSQTPTFYTALSLSLYKDTEKPDTGHTTAVPGSLRNTIGVLTTACSFTVEVITTELANEPHYRPPEPPLAPDSQYLPSLVT